MSENVLGVMTNLEGKGQGRIMRKFSLIFTTSEVIVVKTAGTLSIFKDIMIQTIAESLSVSTILDIYNHLVGKSSESLEAVDVEDFLALDKQNFVIQYMDISKIELKKGGLFNPTGKYKIIISNTKTNYWFRIKDDKEFTLYDNFVKKTLPNKYI